MKRILLFFLALNCVRCFSQDSTRRSFSHLVGIEILGTSGRVTVYQHFSSGTSYKPGYSLFYRVKYKKHLGIESRLLYRSGFGSRTDGGQGGSLTRSGNFEFIRADAGVLFTTHSAYDPGNFECGVKLGHILFQSGDIKSYGTSSFGNTTSNVDVASVLNQNYLGLHLGANFKIKIFKSHFISAGFRLYYETRDYEDASMNLSIGLNLAYVFW